MNDTIKVKCDRCGKSYFDDSSLHASLIDVTERDHNIWKEKKILLCNNCTNEFKEFMRGKHERKAKE